MRSFSIFCIFLLIPTVEATYKYEDFREEDIIGLEDFLSKLDQDTQELVVELLEAKQIQNIEEQDQMMRSIMRKQSPETLNNLFGLYKQTNPKSPTAMLTLPWVSLLLIIVF